MTKFYCDKCKKEFKKECLWNVNISVGKARVVPIKISLCNECVKKLTKYVRMSDDEYFMNMMPAYDE